MSLSLTHPPGGGLGHTGNASRDKSPKMDRIEGCLSDPPTCQVSARGTLAATSLRAQMNRGKGLGAHALIYPPTCQVAAWGVLPMTSLTAHMNGRPCLDPPTCQVAAWGVLPMTS